MSQAPSSPSLQSHGAKLCKIQLSGRDSRLRGKDIVDRGSCGGAQRDPLDRRTCSGFLKRGLIQTGNEFWECLRTEHLQRPSVSNMLGKCVQQWRSKGKAAEDEVGVTGSCQIPEGPGDRWKV